MCKSFSLSSLNNQICFCLCFCVSDNICKHCSLLLLFKLVLNSVVCFSVLTLQNLAKQCPRLCISHLLFILFVACFIFECRENKLPEFSYQSQGRITNCIYKTPWNVIGNLSIYVYILNNYLGNFYAHPLALHNAKSPLEGGFDILTRGGKKPYANACILIIGRNMLQ